MPERPGSCFRAQLPGAAGRVSANQSAYPHRSARYNPSIVAFWFDPALDAAALDWARSTWQAMRPFSKGGVYMNFAGLADDTEQLREAMLGSSQERHEHIRAEYDPDGFETAARRP